MEFAMMGYQSDFQLKLFYYNINLEERIPQNHPLRKIKERIDFDFIYGEVRDRYGENGNVSVPLQLFSPFRLKAVLGKLCQHASNFGADQARRQEPGA